MYSLWLVYLILFTAMLLFFFFQHRRNVALRKRLYQCILVNGIRGKSSTTRLIAAGLRAGQHERVLGKTTGTKAMWLLPDGSEKTITRHGPANIREMATGLALAKELGATMYVAECMAVTPEYQSVIERYWMQSTLVALTNIRPDHEDVYGKGLLAVAKALAACLPKTGTLVTTQETAALLQKVCTLPKERTVLVDPALGRQWLAQFTEPVVAENVAMALTVCRLAGVAPECAITGMLAAATDPGNLEVTACQVHGRAVTFVGAFAANDAVSTLHMAHAHGPQPGQLKGLWLHARKDRRQRTVSLCTALQELAPDFVVFSGDTEFLRRQWPVQELPRGAFDLDLQTPGSLEALLAALPHGPVWLLGAGNTKGVTPQRMGGHVLCQRLS